MTEEEAAEKAGDEENGEGDAAKVVISKEDFLRAARLFPDSAKAMILTYVFMARRDKELAERMHEIALTIYNTLAEKKVPVRGLGYIWVTLGLYLFQNFWQRSSEENKKMLERILDEKSVEEYIG